MTTSHRNWLEKYKPTSIDNVLGNRDSINRIQDYLLQFVNNNVRYSNLVITGGNGVGKTLIVDLLIDKLKLTKTTIDLSSITMAKKPKTKAKTTATKPTLANTSTIDNINTSTSLAAVYAKYTVKQNFFSDKPTINVIVFDDITNKLTTNTEREVIKCLFKHNNRYRKLPIIFINNGKHNKIINELKKLAEYRDAIHNLDNLARVINPANDEVDSDYQLASGHSQGTMSKSQGSSQSTQASSAPTSQSLLKSKRSKSKLKATPTITKNEVVISQTNTHELKAYITGILTIERISLQDSKTSIDKIINHSQFDIRKLMDTIWGIVIYQVKRAYIKTNGLIQVQAQTIDDYISFTKTKDTDPGIFDGSKKLLNSFTTIDNAMDAFNKEKVQIPLMIHKNYLNNINVQYPNMTFDDRMDLICDVSYHISESDRVDGYIFSNQIWNSQDIHGFYSCVMPSYLLNKHPNKKANREDLKYLHDLNKTSIKKINYKVIKNAKCNVKLKRYDIFDFLHMSNIIKYFHARGAIEPMCELIKEYKLTIKELEAVIKIDKINPSSKTKLFSTKQEAMINKICLLKG